MVPIEVDVDSNSTLVVDEPTEKAAKERAAAEQTEQSTSWTLVGYLRRRLGKQL